jgi:ribosomal protein S6--L-glutamate ligase
VRILILSRNAALYSTSRLVLAARARGHEVDVIDPLQLQLIVAPNEPSLRCGGQKLPSYDAVVPRIGASVTRYGLAVVGQLELGAATVLNGGAAIALSRDKVRSLQRLSEERVCVPRTVSLRSLSGLDTAFSLVGGFPAIVKLQEGTQGVGTMLVESRASAHALLETLCSMGQEVLLQEFIRESRGRDVRALVVGGKVVAAMRRSAPRGEFRSNLHRGGQGEAIKLPRRFRSTAIKAAAAVGLDVAGVDMLEGADGPVVVEVNSSPGLEGIETVSEVDVAKAIIAHAEVLRGDQTLRDAAQGSRSNRNGKKTRARAWS